MGSQSYRQEDLVGQVGLVAPVGWVDSLASLQVGWEVQGESVGAIPEVQVVGCLVDPEVGHLVDPEVGRLVDPEVGRLVDLEVDHPEGQVVDSSHLGRQELAPEEVGRSGWHENLGQNKIPGSVVRQRWGVPHGRTHTLTVFQVGGYMGRTADTEELEVARKVYVWMESVRMCD